MDEELPEHLRRFIDKHLTTEEKSQIVDQIYGHSLRNRQVLWTGMAREDAQSWADKHDLQTLTTAMGPLMNPESSRCPQRHKSKNEWTRYVHGASAIFAWYISKGDLVTVLTQPPPQLFHPSGRTSYQVIEEPILKGMLGNRAVGRIELAHPSVPNATVPRYQIWPKNESYRWRPKPHAKIPDARWRQVSLRRPPRGFEVVCGLGGSHKKSGARLGDSDAPKHDNTVSSGSEGHLLKSLEDEHSKAREKLQQRQFQSWKQLLNRLSKEKTSMQNEQLKQRSAASFEEKSEKKRAGIREAHDNEMRHLRKKHRKIEVESKASDDKALSVLKRSQEDQIVALKEMQARNRRKATEAKPKKTSNLVQRHPKADEIPITAKMEEKHDVMERFDNEEQERTPNSGQKWWEAVDLVQTIFLWLLMAGCYYVIDSLMYLT